ncbi:DUF6318 family protein [Actinomyces bouchesdurhonensis]|uniref:DUF6318 family protein n=1 Tax=Actinomyces bouchesdurhonensis TaxID=1852361 RepID=UPI0028E308AE|nr:DUF6318 family protein [Actinomyces bouchesdurhonensis]
MMVPPLSERPVTDEDEEQFRAESAPRKYTLRQRWANHRAQARRNRPAGVKARVRAWMDADIVDWGIRTSITLLIIAGLYAIYTNGVTDGWWPAWGDKPTTAATPTTRPAPTAPATVPTEAAMSGGYQIGPDGILVRPAEHAASTYTKPELPEEAKQNTERGAELAAEHYHALLTYAWNTGDTYPLEDMSEDGDDLRDFYISAIHELYDHGWAYDVTSKVTSIVSVEPITEGKLGAQANTVAVVFGVTSSNGVRCVGQKTSVESNEYNSTFAYYVTWKNERWVITGGSMAREN